jgi:hypothetical protein
VFLFKNLVEILTSWVRERKGKGKRVILERERKVFGIKGVKISGADVSKGTLCKEIRDFLHRPEPQSP